LSDPSASDGDGLAQLLRRIGETLSEWNDEGPKSPNDKGWADDYPLHKVAIWGDLEAARILFAHGANVNAQGEDGDTPLHRAISGDMIQLLLEHGADPSIRNRYGEPALIR
jgi:ankyrin repeat protein